MNELQRITRIALLTALSLILFILEGFLPLPLPVSSLPVSFPSFEETVLSV